MATSAVLARIKKVIKRIEDNWSGDWRAQGIFLHVWYGDAPQNIDDEGGYGDPHEDQRPQMVIDDEVGWIRIK